MAYSMMVAALRRCRATRKDGEPCRDYAVRDGPRGCAPRAGGTTPDRCLASTPRTERRATRRAGAPRTSGPTAPAEARAGGPTCRSTGS